MTYLALQVEHHGDQYRARITVGQVTLEATRTTEAAARAAALGLYEDALFGCNRSDARNCRAKGRQTPWPPEGTITIVEQTSQETQEIHDAAGGA